MKSRKRSLVLLWVMLATAAMPFAAEEKPEKPTDWPQFRGPDRDGISSETGLLASWPDGGPQIVWRRPLGKGFSGLSIVDGRLFTQIASKSEEYVVAIDAARGGDLWRVPSDRERPDQYGAGPRSTPTVDGNIVFTVSAYGKLHALDVVDGSEIWSRDLRREVGAQIPTWGVSASPIIDGNHLIFNAGGKKGHAVVAYDKRSGELKWAAETDKPGYSAPIAVTVGGLRQVIVLSGTYLMSLDPDNGHIWWKIAWPTEYDINAAAPVFVPPDRIFVSSGYSTGAALLRLRVADGRAAIEQLWENPRMRNHFSSSIYHDGHIYGFDNKLFKCLDAASGEERWLKRGFGHGSLFYADGHLIVLGDQGRLALVEASPEAYIEKTAVNLPRGKHWTVPTLYDGRLYVRDERELIVFDIGE